MSLELSFRHYVLLNWWKKGMHPSPIRKFGNVDVLRRYAPQNIHP